MSDFFLGIFTIAYLMGWEIWFLIFILFIVIRGKAAMKSDVKSGKYYGKWY
jgi:hypothetical protein